MKLKEQVKGFLNYDIKTLETTDEYIDIQGYGTVQTKDRDGDVVLVTGIDTTNFEKNPIILYQHDKTKPVGKALEFEKRIDGFYIKARIFKEMSKEAYVGVKNGILKSFSIGFIGKDGKYDETTDTFYFTSSELLEVSIVSIPANPNATFEVAKTLCGSGYCFVERDFSKHHKIDKAIEKIVIKNDEISTKPWGDVDKTRLAQILDDVNDKKAINECYLYVEDYEKRSTWCCPHHEIKSDGTMVVNKGGVIAAYAALKGAHGNKPNIPQDAYNKALKHLSKHYKEMKKQGLIEEIPEDLKEFDISTKDATMDIIDTLVEQSGIPKEQLTKILLFLNFSLVKEDGSKTKFVTKYKFSKETMYEDLYNWLKDFKQKYKNDHEIEAFSTLLKDLGLSAISRASAWIYKTYVVNQNDAENKLLTARTFAESWFFNALGITTENLKKFGKVVKLVDENQQSISDFVGGINYQGKQKGKDLTMEQFEKLMAEISKLSEELKAIKEEAKNVVDDVVTDVEKAFETVEKEIENISVDKALEFYSKIEKAVNDKIKNSL